MHKMIHGYSASCVKTPHVFSLLTETKASGSDLCNKELLISNLVVLDSSGEDDVGEDVELSCLLYPLNTLTCSWLSPTSQNDSHISFFVAVCEKTKLIHSLNYSSEELREDGVSSKSVSLCQDCTNNMKLYVILFYNVSLQNSWTFYAIKYNTEILEVLSPPPNISALVKDGGLLVMWGQPYSRVQAPLSCFEYQLDIGDQERPKNLTGQLSYTEPNTDPTSTYRVRMRTRKSFYCPGSYQWSEWSHTITVPTTESIYKVNTLLIVMISLGLPMMLLAVLLVIWHQRASKLLFPAIPHPPAKYKNFLEKNDTLFGLYPVQPPKYEEEITEVEDAEQNSE